MRRCLWLVLLLGATSIGCVTSSRGIPQANIPLQKADYTIEERRTAEVCHAYIFGISPLRIFGIDKAASVPSADAGFGALLYAIGARAGWSAETGAAMYEVLEEFDGEYTHVMAPNVTTKFTGVGTRSVPLFGERCGQVRAHAVTVEGPFAPPSERRAGENRRPAQPAASSGSTNGGPGEDREEAASPGMDDEQVEAVLARIDALEQAGQRAKALAMLRSEHDEQPDARLTLRMARLELALQDCKQAAELTSRIDAQPNADRIDDSSVANLWETIADQCSAGEGNRESSAEKEESATAEKDASATDENPSTGTDDHETSEASSDEGAAQGEPRVLVSRPTQTRGAGRLDLAEVRDTLREANDEFEKCYRTRLEEEPAASGKIWLDLTLASNGELSLAKSTGDTVGGQIAACATRVVENLEFPSPSGGSVYLKQTFEFRTGE